MANLKKIKNEALDVVRERDFRGYAVDVKNADERVSTIYRLIEIVKYYPIDADALAKRRLLAGLEVLLAEARQDRIYVEALEKIGKQMATDSAGRLSREERRVIKAEMEEVKYAAKNTKYWIRCIGKERDAERRKVSSYLKTQRQIAEQLCLDIISLDEALQRSGCVV